MKLDYYKKRDAGALQALSTKNNSLRKSPTMIREVIRQKYREQI